MLEIKYKIKLNAIKHCIFHYFDTRTLIFAHFTIIFTCSGVEIT